MTTTVIMTVRVSSSTNGGWWRRDVETDELSPPWLATSLSICFISSVPAVFLSGYTSYLWSFSSPPCLSACLNSFAPVYLPLLYPACLPTNLTPPLSVCLSLCLYIYIFTFSLPNLLSDRSTIYRLPPLCSLRALLSNFYIHHTDIILGRQRI